MRSSMIQSSHQISEDFFRIFCPYPVWPEKIAKRLYKLHKNYFIRKRIDFDTFTKIAKNVGDLGKLIIAKGFKNLPKVLRPIWSHCPYLNGCLLTLQGLVINNILHSLTMKCRNKAL